jgi:MoaA/NifB/PqqE/SkfB family radical SAM enzyme
MPKHTGQPLTTAKYLHLQLTERCNLACPGCYLPERAGKGLDAREIEQRVFAPLAESGVRYATLTGGEPLLHPQWLEVCTAAVRHFEDVQLVSNGMLLDAACYEALREAGLRAIKVSLDGPTAAVHDALRGKAGCFNQVTANLRAILALPAERRGDINLGCICTMHRENVRLLGEIAAFVQDMGLDSLLFQPYHPYGMLYPASGGPVARPEADAAFLTVLDEQVENLRSLRRARPGFLDNSLEMLVKFKDFYTAPCGPSQVCGADRFVFVNSALQVRGCLFCEPLGELGTGGVGEDWLAAFRRGEAWQGFERFRRGCTRCLMGCQYVDQAKELAEKGHELLAAEDPAGARAAFDASLALEYSPTAGHGAGLSRLRLGQATEARPLLEAALEHRPADRFILGDLGDVLLRQGAWDELMAMADRLAEIPQGLVKAGQFRGFNARRLGDNETAIVLLRAFMETEPEHEPWPHFEYGFACLLGGHFEEAERHIRMAVERDDAFPWFRYRLAQALQGLGRTPEAIHFCREAIRLDAGPQAFHTLLDELLSGPAA